MDCLNKFPSVDAHQTQVMWHCLKWYSCWIMSHHKESYSPQICMEERNQATERVEWWASVNEGRFTPHQPDVVRRHRWLHLQGHLTCWKRLENCPTGSHVSRNRHTHRSTATCMVDTKHSEANILVHFTCTRYVLEWYCRRKMLGSQMQFWSQENLPKMACNDRTEDGAAVIVHVCVWREKDKARVE